MLCMRFWGGLGTRSALATQGASSQLCLAVEQLLLITKDLLLQHWPVALKIPGGMPHAEENLRNAEQRQRFINVELMSS